MPSGKRNCGLVSSSQPVLSDPGLAEDLQDGGWAAAWSSHRVVFLAQEIIYWGQAGELHWSKAFWKNAYCSLCIAGTWFILYGFIKKLVTAVFFRIIVLFLFIFINNHFYKSSGYIWMQIRFQNVDASQENACKCIFISKDCSRYCKWHTKLLQNIHIRMNNITVSCTVKNSQTLLLPRH